MYATPPPYSPSVHRFFSEQFTSKHGGMTFWSSKCTCGWQWVYVDIDGKILPNGNVDINKSIQKHQEHLKDL